MMQMSSDIPFNERVLKWAREWHGRSYEQAAKKAGVTAERIIQWEAGEAKPTVRQARLLADAYERPFLEFFSPEIPSVRRSELVPDFRLYQEAPEPAESRELIHIQEWAESQRLNALDLFDLLAEKAPSFPQTLFATLSDRPEAIAAMARETIVFPVSEQMNKSVADRDRLPGKLRSRFEALGVLVLKHSGLKKLRARGICIFYPSLPIIVFANEAPAAQAFTLVHELAHIILRKSAVIGEFYQPMGPTDIARTERWCDQFAAAFLVPAHVLAEHRSRPIRPAERISNDELKSLAAKFGVSRHAMLIRLVELGYVQKDFYWKIKRAQFKAEEASYEAQGRASYYASRYRSACGDLYTGLVLEAWATGRITNHNACEFMGIKNLAHLNAVRDHFVD